MFGLTFEKLLLIGVIAVFVIGPERLPAYSAKFGQLVRKLKEMSSGAKDRIKEELGDDFDEEEWKKLDPRQYDPRRIIREALLDDAPVNKAPVAAPVVKKPVVRDTNASTPFDLEST
ncbi:sec-independent protein translocase protein TatB [Aurantimicrobium minutum]|uniref:twin-arginine translocase TatA/TatE family subunit n=1 Tax=Aurantimicrobium minutum TaxID=708131 RepID=UPI002472ECFB|nr:twin-arginine translocase TatA/TatE family subunit [Aurantimicrobium minutum]MDH6207021.1 sec-independent protein translocase protein TatB [Aurantimicrobium minutum]MDH6410251.1 sec-independent protein translocase protein TatB [Aurantimicrobium minutum]MDH6424386.1 sec-independent protein translocase protein TatB [Aurantimicrobium minutum]